MITTIFNNEMILEISRVCTPSGLPGHDLRLSGQLSCHAGDWAAMTTFIGATRKVVHQPRGRKGRIF